MLSPRDRALAAKVRDIVLRGRGAELRCIETRPVKGDLQRTLLASAARSAHGRDRRRGARRPVHRAMSDAPLRPGARIALAALWLAVLLVAGWAIAQRLQLSGDLRKFMPSARTPEQKLLIDELGEGPGSRLLLVDLVRRARCANARRAIACLARDAVEGHALHAGRQWRRRPRSLSRTPASVSLSAVADARYAALRCGVSCAEQVQSRVRRSRFARRRSGRTADAERSDAGNAGARRNLGAGDCAATHRRRVVRPRRQAGVARGADARGGFRSDGPARCRRCDPMRHTPPRSTGNPARCR